MPQMGTTSPPVAETTTTTTATATSSTTTPTSTTSGKTTDHEDNNNNINNNNNHEDTNSNSNGNSNENNNNDNDNSGRVKTSRSKGISIWVLMSLFTFGATTAVALTTWLTSYIAGTHVATNLANELQIRILDQPIYVFSTRFNSALYSVRANRHRFRSGLYSVDTQEERMLTIRSMFFDIRSHATLQYDAMQFYLPTVDGSPTYEAYAEQMDNSTSFWWIFNQSDTYNGYYVDPDTALPIYDHPSVVYTNYSSESQPWYTSVNRSNMTSEAWSPLYVMYDEAWLSVSTILTNSSDAYLGVGTVDISCSFVNALLHQEAGRSNYDTFLVAIYVNGETANWQIAGTSNMSYHVLIDTDTGQDVVPMADLQPNETVVETIPNPPNIKVKSLHDATREMDCLRNAIAHINRTYGSTDDLITRLAAVGSSIQFEVNCSRGDQIATVGRAYTQGINWFILGFMKKEQIYADLVRSTHRNIAITLAIAIGATLIASFFALFLRRLLLNIARDIDLLTENRFSEVIGQNRKGSLLTEVNDVQSSLYTLVTNFADVIQAQLTLMLAGNAGGQRFSTGSSEGFDLDKDKDKSNGFGYDGTTATNFSHGEGNYIDNDDHMDSGNRTSDTLINSIHAGQIQKLQNRQNTRRSSVMELFESNNPNRPSRNSSLDDSISVWNTANSYQGGNSGLVSGSDNSVNFQRPIPSSKEPNFSQDEVLNPKGGYFDRNLLRGSYKPSMSEGEYNYNNNDNDTHSDTTLRSQHSINNHQFHAQNHLNPTVNELTHSVVPIQFVSESSGLETATSGVEDDSRGNFDIQGDPLDWDAPVLRERQSSSSTANSTVVAHEVHPGRSGVDMFEHFFSVEVHRAEVASSPNILPSDSSDG